MISLINILRLAYSIPIWILYLILDNFLILLGWITIPISAACGAYEKGIKWDGSVLYHFTWKWMYIWDNFEDGIADSTYWKAPNMFLQIMYWSALRNSTNNLRTIPYLSCKIDPKNVKYVGDQNSVEKYDTPIPQWYFAWHGFYTNYWKQFYIGKSLYRFWIGWKIMPADTIKVSTYRKDGAGFALQFKKIK